MLNHFSWFINSVHITLKRGNVNFTIMQCEVGSVFLTPHGSSLSYHLSIVRMATNKCRPSIYLTLFHFYLCTELQKKILQMLYMSLPVSTRVRKEAILINVRLSKLTLRSFQFLSNPRNNDKNENFHTLTP